MNRSHAIMMANFKITLNDCDPLMSLSFSSQPIKIHFPFSPSRLIGFIVSFLLLPVMLSMTSLAQAQEAPLGVESPSWILIDGNSGQTLAEHNPDQRRSIASLTKLVTTLVVYRAIEAGQLHWNEMVTVPQAVRQLGSDTSRMYLIPGQQVSVNDLMHGLIIVSANDAAVTLAIAEAGSLDNFVAKMNATARSLGMHNTHFENVDGLTEAGHYSTARDLSKIAMTVANEFPGYFQISSQPSFKWGTFHGEATNALVGPHSNIDGMKTGYTQAAGYCVIASEHRPNADGSSHRIFAVVLGTDTYNRRFQDANKLLDYAYNYFYDVNVASAGVPIGQLPLVKSSENSVGVTVDRNLVLSMPNSIPANRLKGTIIANHADLEGPIKSGQVVGKYQISLGNHVISSGPVFATEPVERAGLISRFFSTIGSWFSSAPATSVPFKIG